MKKKYVSGKIEGLCEAWYENGQLRMKGNYLNGYENGSFEYWYSDGQSHEKCNYINGTWKDYMNHGIVMGNYMKNVIL